MVQYKLTYFPVRARGETARLILHYANMPFEDNRVSQEDWPKIKPTTPFGQMPVLEVDGKPLAQSYAINRFLARKYGLAGKDDFEAAQLDSLADLKTDFQNEIRPYIMLLRGKGEGDKDKLYNETVKPAFSKFAPILVKTLKESGTGFYGKGGVSWVDFELGGMVYTVKDIFKELLDNYPELVQHMERVHSLPQLKKYLETRPQTPV